MARARLRDSVYSTWGGAYIVLLYNITTLVIAMNLVNVHILYCRIKGYLVYCCHWVSIL